MGRLNIATALGSNAVTVISNISSGLMGDSYSFIESGITWVILPSLAISEKYNISFDGLQDVMASNKTGIKSIYFFIGVFLAWQRYDFFSVLIYFLNELIPFLLYVETSFFAVIG